MEITPACRDWNAGISSGNAQTMGATKSSSSIVTWEEAVRHQPPGHQFSRIPDWQPPGSLCCCCHCKKQPVFEGLVLRQQQLELSPPLSLRLPPHPLPMEVSTHSIPASTQDTSFEVRLLLVLSLSLFFFYISKCMVAQ